MLVKNRCHDSSVSMLVSGVLQVFDWHLIALINGTPIGGDGGVETKHRRMPHEPHCI